MVPERFSRLSFVSSLSLPVPEVIEKPGMLKLPLRPIYVTKSSLLLLSSLPVLNARKLDYFGLTINLRQNFLLQISVFPLGLKMVKELYLIE